MSNNLSVFLLRIVFATGITALCSTGMWWTLHEAHQSDHHVPSVGYWSCGFLIFAAWFTTLGVNALFKIDDITREAKKVSR